MRLSFQTKLSAVLNSPTAIKVSIQIIRVFTRVREMFTDSLSVKMEIEEIKKKLTNHGKNIELVLSYLDELINKKRQYRTKKKNRLQIEIKELKRLLFLCSKIFSTKRAFKHIESPFLIQNKKPPKIRFLVVSVSQIIRYYKVCFGLKPSSLNSL